MLRDEVVRTAIVLYVCGDVAGQRIKDDLLALARAAAALADDDARILVVSATGLEELKALQRDLHLPFPLLHDDRGFAAHYGVSEGAGEPDPRVLLVDRRQRVAWTGAPGQQVVEALPALHATIRGLPSPSSSLPRQIVNRIVDRWVN
jgi:peroxiredoxin